MPHLYRCESCYPQPNAQRNLSGRTHYADPDTLRYFKSRILASGNTDNGLLFWLIESCALDMHNTKRGFRYVIFDVFGNVLERPNFEECYKSHATAKKAMWKALNALDAIALTRQAAESALLRHTRDHNDLMNQLAKIEKEGKAA